MSTTTLPAHNSETSSNVEAEQAVIGAILMDGDKLLEVSGILEPADFHDPVFRSIYSICIELLQQRTSIDIIAVADRLQANESFAKLGGSAFLAGLISRVPTSAIAQQYAEIVKEKSIRRRVGEIGSKLLNLSTDIDQSATDIIQGAEQQLQRLSQEASSAEWTALNDACHDRYELYSAAFSSDDPDAYSGLKTGFSNLDRLLGGLHPSDLMIIAARPSMGKTALAMNMARNMAKAGKRVGVFSLEMSREQLTDRLVAGDLGVESRKLTRGLVTDDEFDQLGSVMDSLGMLPIYIDDTVKKTADISSKARKLQAMTGLDAIVIDYLQLIVASGTTARDNRVQQISEMTRQLKLLGRELKVPVILLSQLNRDCEKRNPPIPMESDLRDSGSIEQDADSILMLYRQGKYDEDCEHPTLTNVYVRKNRQGPTGHVQLDFDPERVRFTPVVPNTAFQSTGSTP